MNYRKFTFNRGKIQATCIDGNYLWVAYYTSATTSDLYKCDLINPEIVYFAISTPTIVKIVKSGTYVYIALNHSSYIAMQIHATNPIGEQYNITKHVSIDQVPVDMIINGTMNDIYFLLPGTESLKDCKVVLYNMGDRTYNQTITLTESTKVIRDATKMINDASNNIWIVTNTNPAQLVKLYVLSSDIWVYDVWDITN
jgi:hypothetical protein